MADLVGLTGKSGTGKTKVCQQIVEAAKSAGFSVFGFYCPAVFDGEEKIAIEVRLLPAGETYLLGSLEKHENWQPIGRWWMDPGVFDLVNDHLKQFEGSDLLLIDEIGPAEIEDHQGWTMAMKLLKENQYKLGIVSFRPAYIQLFKDTFQGIKVIDLAKGSESDLQNLIERFCKPSLWV